MPRLAVPIMFGQILMRGLATTKTPAVIEAMYEKLKGSKNFLGAVRREAIDLSTLKCCPANKVAEISGLFDRQKHYPDALVFIDKYQLFSIDTLMACDLNVIQAYKNYLYILSPEVTDKGLAMNLEHFKKLSPAFQSALGRNIEDAEARYTSSGCGC